MIVGAGRGSEGGESDPVGISIRQWGELWPELDVSAMDVLGRVHRVFLHYQARINQVFEREGISASSFGVLAALYRIGPPHRLQVTELASRTMISTGGMTQRLDRLEGLGLIERMRDDADRRAVHARLTESGIACARRVARAHFENERQMLHLLDPEGRHDLATGLRLLERSILSSTAPE